MSAALSAYALMAVGYNDEGDDAPALTAIDALGQDVEVLRWRLEHDEGMDRAVVGAVDRIQARLLFIRALVSKGAADGKAH